MKDKITVLLTNDDGIEAPGLQALKREFETREDVVLWTVAPDRGQSSTGHGMSLVRPVFADELAPRTFAVDGLPVDCVYLGLYKLMDTTPDVVVSGINRGANLGKDVIYSGTVAAAREAALNSIHGVASSLVHGSDYEAAAASVVDIACRVARTEADPMLLNLNYPEGSFEGPKFGRLGVRKYPRVVTERIAPLDKRKYYWLGGPPIGDEGAHGTDGWLVGSGVASATFLRLDQTDDDRMADGQEDLPFIGIQEESAEKAR